MDWPVIEFNDETVAALVIIVWLVGGTLTGGIIGGFNGAVTGLLFALLCLPGILFAMGIGFFKQHEDIFG